MEPSSLLPIVIFAVFGLLLGAVASFFSVEKRRKLKLAAAKSKSAQLKRDARKAARGKTNQVIESLRDSLKSKQDEVSERVAVALEKLEKRRNALDAREAEAEEVRAVVDDNWQDVDRSFDAVKSTKDRARGLWKDIEDRKNKQIANLAERAGESPEEVSSKIQEEWRGTVRNSWNLKMRDIEQSAADSWAEHEARRLMAVASSRYQNHFLTEKNRATLRLDDKTYALISDHSNGILQQIGEVSTITLHDIEDGVGYRMEGLDGVGREVVRRAFKRLYRKEQAVAKALKDPAAWSQNIRKNLEKEIRDLGRKAFNVLKIPKPHEDIVELVGALNYRTSYTQNQWLHAVEASFLASMIAEEMGLDVKIARRATLMHDIGKALTHKIEGSHAVIGADLARKLGEDEMVANAIGAHHADEPPNSVYAYIVAGCDAMSGARPGARREQTDGFNTRVEDIQRIAESYPGVEQAHAVHGGREVRVYVQPRVSDEKVISLSESISEQITEEMTYPGQIKVTVIRQYEAVTTTI